jgi:hypothetical protein
MVQIIHLVIYFLLLIFSYKINNREIIKIETIIIK